MNIQFENIATYTVFGKQNNLNKKAVVYEKMTVFCWSNFPSCYQVVGTNCPEHVNANATGHPEGWLSADGRTASGEDPRSPASRRSQWNRAPEGTCQPPHAPLSDPSDSDSCGPPFISFKLTTEHNSRLLHYCQVYTIIIPGYLLKLDNLITKSNDKFCISLLI